MDRSFQRWLIVGQATLVLVLGAAVGTAILAVHVTAQHAAEAIHIRERLALLDQLRGDARELARSARRYLLTRDPQERRRVLAIEARVAEDRRHLRERMIREDTRELERVLDAYVAAVTRAMSEEPGDLASTLARFEDELARARRSVGEVFDDLLARERSLHSSASSRWQVRGARWALPIAGALGLLLSAGVTLGVIRLFARHRERTRRGEADAERVADARRELLAASDELRAPLDAILARCAQLRSAGSRGEADRQALEAIATSASSLARSLDALLHLTAIGTGSVSLRREPCDAASLVERAIERHRDAAHARGIRVRSEAQPGTSVSADRERVGHVLEMLLHDAIATARVGAEIVISAAPARDGVRFAIIDASPPPPAPLDRAYEPAAAPSDRLDLLLCKRVIGASRGRLGIEAAATGRTYWFTLPTEPSLLR